MNVQLTRHQLYRWIWTTPVDHVAEVLGISGSAVAKTCRRYRVPTPARGYWRKVQTGQSVSPTPLPDAEDVRLTPVEVSEDIARDLSGDASTFKFEKREPEEEVVSEGRQNLGREHATTRGKIEAESSMEAACLKAILHGPEAPQSESMNQPDAAGLIWFAMEDSRFAQLVCALDRLHSKLPEVDPSTAATVSLWLLAARQQLQHLDPVEQIVESCRLIAMGVVDRPQWWKAVQGLN